MKPGSTIKSSKCLLNERTLRIYIMGLVNTIDQCSFNRFISRKTGYLSDVCIYVFLVMLALTVLTYYYGIKQGWKVKMGTQSV